MALPTGPIAPIFQIFDDIELPKSTRSGGPTGPRGSKYPINANFKVGSAFLVPAAQAEDGSSLDSKEDLAKQAKSVQSSINRLAKEFKFKLAVRPLTAEKSPWADEQGVGIPGVGVWRVAGVYEAKPREAKAE